MAARHDRPLALLDFLHTDGTILTHYFLHPFRHGLQATPDGIPLRPMRLQRSRVSLKGVCVDAQGFQQRGMGVNHFGRRDRFEWTQLRQQRARSLYLRLCVLTMSLHTFYLSLHGHQLFLHGSLQRLYEPTFTGFGITMAHLHRPLGISRIQGVHHVAHAAPLGDTNMIRS